MGVQFGTCNDPTNKINRTYSLGGANTFAPYGSVDVINPVIIVSSGAVSSTDSVMYISDYARYYNITGIQYDGKRAIVTGAVDVAKTYADAFYTSQFVTRSQSGYNKNLPDTNLSECKPRTIVNAISNGSTFGNVTGSSRCYMIGVM